VYQRLLLDANAVDFDDLLMHVALLLRDNPELRRALDSRYRFILVDEYQDTNLAQYAVMRGLSIDYPNVAATGDPDQSIYSWRGADIANIVRFEEDYPQAKVVRLEENFRSTQRIVETAAHLIAHNRYRKPKSLYTKNPPGSAVRLVRYESGEEEAYDIAEQIRQKIDQGRRPGEFAVFYRTNALSRALEQAMRREGIPYQVVRGLEFYERREVKDLLAYLYLLNNPRDEWAFRRVLNVPPRGIGRQTFKKLSEFAYQKRLSLMEAARDRRFLDSLSRRLAEKLQLFTDQYQRWRKLVDKPVAEILQAIIQDIDYLNYVAALDEGPDIDRPGNVNELLSDAAEFDAQRGQGPWLEAFLERVSLVSDTDTWDSAGSKVSLMTLHAAKGLEFPVVYIIGVEEGLLPHDRSRNDEQSVEEERRLLFVGITRAQEELQLSFAMRRLAHTGALPMRVPSAFLQELPLGALERVGIDAYGMSAQRAFEDEAIADDEPLDEEPPDELAWQVDEDRFAYPRQSTFANRRPKKAGLTAGRPHENSPATSAMPASTVAPAVQGREAGDRRFAVGDLVRHPAHGRGTIVRASGEGKRRVVKVVFDSAPDCPISFYVAYSPLEPLPPVVPPEADDS
jgi:DNA helicase-2/ATP-dependent DNA helicase PcrA